MTREEQLQEFDQITGWCRDNPIHVLHVARGMYRRLIDDFESRTCENCRFLKDIEKSYKKCDLLTVNIGWDEEKEFGCNYFEGRNDGNSQCR